MHSLILASTSPRRKELLEKLGIPFQVVPSPYEEDHTITLSPHDFAQHLALEKARAVAASHEHALVIGADTIVVAHHEILGKPVDAAHAQRMLQHLSGTTHEVITAVALIDTKGQHEKVFYEATRVTMKTVSPQLIEAYIATGEPFDKAGGYGIQGYGALLVDRIEGDFFTVMGLPIARLADELLQRGFPILSI